MTLSDKALVARVLRGDESAFRMFFQAYFTRLFRFALYRVNGDADLAEDVAQTTLIKALDNLSSYRGEAALLSWMCTICRHEISAVLKHEARIPTVLVDDDISVRAALESLIDADGTPESKLGLAELARLIKVTLDSLPIDYGDALEWKYIDGMSVAEIGDRLGRSRKAAESLLNRAREAFRDGFTALTGSAHDYMQEQLR
jgi:RNA polymerase sigma-70 factor (ECF subfamily)